ncbi:F1F0 ATP synthase, alpha subunit [Monoraphidium neglectum]|uniref:F1F0 ATP synthase, alpha subunit n=1 Tax=Monoraphidium neglectum TaxID=145388 RepID=A0A0D2LYI9_9CHLO|nr:F1F0 ATP synthase, alpha subunit [Monoraphidium neglectum]KIY96469.1 F1F0 ATP synthase, alpha subunit [Monoraphidium neglectum]|eukprot:XP_013895489.1 F1F0 ATP synthase, alpha subunit [Monoraphidium neglectum]
MLAFVSGASGVLMWHRSDNMAFVIVTGGAGLVQEGEAVECKIKGVLQVVDEAKGPITKKDYEMMQAPAGDGLFGSVVDFMGRPLSGFPAQGSSGATSTSSSGSGSGGSDSTEQSQQAQQDGAAAPAPGQQQSVEDEDGAPPRGGGPFIGFDKTRPLVNQQVAMAHREQITESLSTAGGGDAASG